MTQLVFVHGVATRPGPGYDRQVQSRDQLLHDVLFEGAPLAITTAMWGDLVPPLAWGGAIFPKGEERPQSLSIFGGLAPQAEANAAAGQRSILAEAERLDAAPVIDDLFAALIEQATAEGRALTPDELAQFRAATRYLMDPPQAVALPDATDDTGLVAAVRAEIGVAGGYGIADTLRQAAGAVTDRARNLVGKGLVGLFREDLNPAVALFLGDVFTYLKPGAVREAIRAEVVSRLLSAHKAAQASGERLILMGHSLGGVILYDLLSSPDLAGLPADFSADAFVTVGSQPGLFEELGLFDFHAPGRNPPSRIEGPANVGLWINIYDPIDLFGFRADPVFAAAHDFAFDSGTGLASAHTSYFSRPQFYARLRRRLIDAGLLGAGP